MLKAVSRSFVQFVHSRRAHLDADVISALAMRISNALLGFVSASLIVTYLNPVEQGYWYTFSSLLSIAAFAEMGAGQVILRTAAREVGLMIHTEKYERAVSRLKAIFRFTISLGIWTSLSSVVIALIVGLWWLRDSNNKSGVQVNHTLPWVFAAICSGPALFLSFGNAYFEGWQYVAASNRRRIIISWATLAGTWIAFVSGAKLFTYGTGRGIGAAVGLYTLWRQYRSWKGRYRLEEVRAESFAWKTDFLPLQIRYAMTWLSAIFVTGLFAPLIFKYTGPTDAGKYGLTMSVITVLTGASTSWVSARQARMSALAGSDRLAELSVLIKGITKVSIAAYATGAICCFIGLRYIGVIFPHVAKRIMNPGDIAFALCGGFLLVLMTILWNFVRSFGGEPFVRLAWCQAGLTLLLGIPAVFYLGTTGAVITYLIGNLVAVPVAWRIAKPYFERMTRQEEL